MSILTGKAIRDQLALGNIEIDPFDPKRVRTNSVDLTLGKEVRVYSGCVIDRVSGRCADQIERESSYGRSTRLTPDYKFPRVLDTKSPNQSFSFLMDASGCLVRPGILYLMHTHERVHTKKFVTQLNGKSSIARLGVIVHFTAAYGDTGFNGQYTLEVSAMHPVVLYPGMAIAQAVFYTCEGEIEDYSLTGHYTGEAAKGAEPSHSYEQFEETR